jgi:hypothetical protein
MKQVIGTRKMIVIMWCVAAITIIVGMHLYWRIPIDWPSLSAMGLISGLGGVHVFKQGSIDSKLPGLPWGNTFNGKDIKPNE